MRKTGTLARAWPRCSRTDTFSPRLHPHTGGPIVAFEEHFESFLWLHAGAGPFGHAGLALGLSKRSEAKFPPLLHFSRMLGVVCRDAEVSCSRESIVNTGRPTVQLSMPTVRPANCLDRPVFSSPCLPHVEALWIGAFGGLGGQSDSQESFPVLNTRQTGWQVFCLQQKKLVMTSRGPSTGIAGV